MPLKGFIHNGLEYLYPYAKHAGKSGATTPYNGNSETENRTVYEWVTKQYSLIGKLFLTLIVICDIRLQSYGKSKVNKQSENHTAYINELLLIQLWRKYEYDSERKIRQQPC